MSDHMMSVEEARAVLELDSAPLPMRQAARTIVAQAEQNTRLQAALRHADREAHAAWQHCDDLHGDYEEPVWEDEYESLLPGDMEDPEVKE